MAPIAESHLADSKDKFQVVWVETKPDETMFILDQQSGRLLIYRLNRYQRSGPPDLLGSFALDKLFH